MKKSVLITLLVVLVAGIALLVFFLHRSSTKPDTPDCTEEQSLSPDGWYERTFEGENGDVVKKEILLIDYKVKEESINGQTQPLETKVQHYVKSNEEDAMALFDELVEKYDCVNIERYERSDSSSCSGGLVKTVWVIFYGNENENEL